MSVSGYDQRLAPLKFRTNETCQLTGLCQTTNSHSGALSGSQKQWHFTRPHKCICCKYMFCVCMCWAQCKQKLYKLENNLLAMLGKKYIVARMCIWELEVGGRYIVRTQNHFPEANENNFRFLCSSRLDVCTRMCALLLLLCCYMCVFVVVVQVTITEECMLLLLFQWLRVALPFAICSNFLCAYCLLTAMPWINAA